VLDHLAEGVLQLGGHPQLEQREQRLRGEGPEGVDALDQLLPALVGLARLVEGLPQLFEEELREAA